MPLAPGTKLGSYEILAPLGAGGMGEVYRARDTRLGRDVAIKILPEPFLSDPDRVARFQREAQLLAALNHPYIAGIYGFEESGETRFLVMELVEGESLAERLSPADGSKASGLPVAEALALARQIAEALQAAHEKGIIHRDLKPGNVMLTGDGQVKVLDFGLAKMLGEDRPDSSSNAAMSPTLSLHATYAGVILGTAAYMSPEQARGKVADKRTDVWAFGCVVFEMLTGRRAFEGEDATDTMAAVVRGEPDWSALPSDLPADVVILVRRCLQKDRRQRFADISVPLFLMNEPREVAAAIAQPPAKPRPMWRRALPLAATAVIVAAVTSTVMWGLRPVALSPIVTRFPIRLGEGQQFTNTGRQFLAISHDGSHVAYVANLRLYLRSMSDLEARPIPGTEEPAGGVTNPVFSPDGGSIAFYANGAIKRIAITGGAAATICSALNPFGMSWHDDEIVFGQDPIGIVRVSADGGKPETLISVKADEVAYGPQVLPGGQSVLFTLGVRNTRDWDRAQIVIQSLKSGERKIVVSGGSDARYLPTGHLVYVLGGVVFAVRFDAGRLAIAGAAVPVIEGVQRGSSAGVVAPAQFSSSDNGSLIYVPGPAIGAIGASDVGVLDRQGSVQPLKLPVAAYEYPRVSPDGTRLAIGTDDGKEAIIWIYELSGATAPTRLTFGGRNRVPVWSGDGERVAFQSDREGAPAVFWQRADGNGKAERLTTPEKGTTHTPQSWSRDGEWLLFTELKAARVTLWTFSRQTKQVSPFGGIDGANVTAAFSPDGRWVAYQSSGIFVQPFPATGSTYQIATGTIHPFWSPDGKELFNVPRSRLQVVRITYEPSFKVSSPVDVPRGSLLEHGPAFERNVDVMHDGKRFVGVIMAGPTDTGPVTPTIQAVEHWFEELKSKAR